jgi:hypothetical protein
MNDTTLDLDKVRDEKCIPIAREVMKDIATTLLPEDANVLIDYNPIILKVLQRNLDNDLNIKIETPYVFQLILGALAGLNKTVQECTAVPIDDIRYGKIGNKILSILAESNIRLGNVTPEEVDADFADVKVKINELFSEEKLSMMEVKYIMDNIFEAFKVMNAGFNQSLENSVERAEAKLLGIEFMSDLTMKKLNDVLVSTTVQKIPDQASA